MTRQDERRPVLEAEVKRWSAMSTKQLLAELKDAQAYPVEVESSSTPMELLENTARHIHVARQWTTGQPPGIFPSIEPQFHSREVSRRLPRNRSTYFAWPKCTVSCVPPA